MSTLYDIRQQLFKDHFAKGLDYPNYVETSSDAHKKRWSSSYENISLTSTQNDLVSSFMREINVLVISGSWCGDCIRQCPIIAKIGEASPKLTVRFLDNQENPELSDELRIHGASRVPVAVFLSEDFYEVSRFGDRTLSVYRDKAINEAGAACAIGTHSTEESAKNSEQQEWIDCFERAHLLLRTSGLLRKRYSD